MTTSVTRQQNKTTPDLQDQDQDRFFWSLTGLVLRPTVSDHITDTVMWSTSWRCIIIIIIITDTYDYGAVFIAFFYIFSV